MPQNKGVRYFASNPGQKLTARFLDGGVRIESSRDDDWTGRSSGAVQSGELRLTLSLEGLEARVRLMCLPAMARIGRRKPT